MFIHSYLKKQTVTPNLITTDIQKKKVNNKKLIVTCNLIRIMNKICIYNDADDSHWHRILKLDIPTSYIIFLGLYIYIYIYMYVCVCMCVCVCVCVCVSVSICVRA